MSSEYRLIAFGVVLLTSCDVRSSERSGDILLLTADTLRPDHMGIYGYERSTTPALDSFFEGSLVFERAYSTEANTSPSVASMLTGELPQDHRVRLLYQLLESDIPIITELLPPEYQTAGFVSNIVLTEEAFGISDRFDHYDDFVDEKEPLRVSYERSANRTTDAVERWLETERDTTRPIFLWVHYIDPHGPYRPPAHWERSFGHDSPLLIEEERIPAYTREEGVLDGLAYVDAYDEEIAYMDSEIGRLLDSYSRLSGIETALVIFTADHGESMMEHERWFTHGYRPYEEIVRVPLMIRGPEFNLGRSEALSSGIDLVPTMLAFAGAPIPSQLKGFDLRRVDDIPINRVVFAEATEDNDQLRAAIGYTGKWMVGLRRGDSDPVQRICFDLLGDPGELVRMKWPEQSANLPGVAQLLELIRVDPDLGGLPLRSVGGIRLTAPKVDPRVSEEVIEQLEMLGYAGQDEHFDENSESSAPPGPQNEE